jgi:hypothetical protein
VLSSNERVIEQAGLVLSEGQNAPCPVGKAFEHPQKGTGQDRRAPKADGEVATPSATTMCSAGCAGHPQADHGNDVALHLVRPTTEGEDGLAPGLILQAATEDRTW